MLASILILVIVFVAENNYGLEPCLLCKYQRIPYFAAILFAGLALHVELANHRGALKCIGIIFFLGAIIAFYHNGIEQQWWYTTSCGTSQKFPLSFENFYSQLLTKMPKRCDEIDWTLLGLSMTVYNMLISVGLGVLCLTSGLIYRYLAPNSSKGD